MPDTTNIHSFQGDLEKMIAKCGGLKKLVVAKVSLDLWKNVTERTPVDTGRARANWNLTEGAPSQAVADHAEAKTGGVPAPAAPDVSGISGDKPVYLINNLPYVEALDKGHSQQAPMGFRTLAMQEEAARIEAAVRSLADG